ncbi:MAG: hypothetical protein P1U63_05355 [Coxiellaceae bacterium]|nr:hypothetical protein [Coxiellaceae bacterium]
MRAKVDPEVLLMVRRRAKALAIAAAKDTPYSHLLKRALFDTLRANAKPVFNLFSDIYLRDGAESPGVRLAELVCVETAADKPQEEAKVADIPGLPAPIPISTLGLGLFRGLLEKVPDRECRIAAHMVDSFAEGLHDLTPQYFQIVEKVDGRGERYHVLKASSESSSKSAINKILLTYPGRCGALPALEKQLDIFVEKYLSGVTDVGSLTHFDGLLNADIRIGDCRYSFDVDIPAAIEATTAQLQRDLDGQLDLIATDRDDLSEERGFYYQLIRTLLKEKAIEVEGELDDVFRRSLSRIKDLLTLSTDLDYYNFTLAINLCMDEILLLNIPSRLGCSAEELSEKQREVNAVTADFMEYVVGVRPQFSTFTSSGMQSIFRPIQSALTAARKAGDEALICLGDASYYEIASALYLHKKPHHYLPGVGELYKIIPEKPAGGSSRVTGFTADEKDMAEGLLVDIYVGSFENNVELSMTKNRYNNINQFVEKQFELRDAVVMTGQAVKPLVVVIDNTMSHFDDVHITWMLEEFAERVGGGQLAVVIANSLNKQFHMGTDKTPLGLLSVYARPEIFPHLTCLTSHEVSTHTIAEMDPFSPTLNLATKIMTDCTGMISVLADKVKGRVRFLHDKVFDASLLSNKHCVFIDDPVNDASLEGLLKGDPCISTVWPFINIRIKLPDYLHKTYPTFADAIRSRMDALLQALGISPRDGYAFSQSCFAHISSHVMPDKLLRISVGTESIDDLSRVCSVLSEFMVRVNELLDPICAVECLPEKVAAFNIIVRDCFAKADACVAQEKTPLLAGARSNEVAGEFSSSSSSSDAGVLRPGPAGL